MNRFIVLGSANAVPKIGQDNTHLYLESGEKKIMVDCGDNPITKLASINVNANDVTDLILTHFHPDHAGSLPSLIITMWIEKRTAPLVIHGLEFTLERAKKLLELFGWENWKNMYPVTFAPIAETGVEGFITGSGIKVTALPVLHLLPTIGLRFEMVNDRIITYSCDTEPCDALYKLANGADVLLQESAGESKGHSSARQAGEIATVSRVKRLVLIHYDRRVGEESLISDAKKGFSGEVLCAKDLMVI